MWGWLDNGESCPGTEGSGGISCLKQGGRSYHRTSPLIKGREEAEESSKGRIIICILESRVLKEVNRVDKRSVSGYL